MNLLAATPADSAAMALAHAQCFPTGWSDEEFEALLEGHGLYGFLALDGDRPAGVILCRTAADETEVLTIGVIPAARGRGVARALLVAALGVARAMGAAACFLDVAVDNLAAIGLYERLGFQRAGLRPRYYDRGAEGNADALLMRLDLTANPE